MSTIGTESAFEAAARARALEATGRSVIHLEIGEPDFDTPPNIRAAANAAPDDLAPPHDPPARGDGRPRRGPPPLPAVRRHPRAPPRDRRGLDPPEGLPRRSV